MKTKIKYIVLITLSMLIALGLKSYARITTSDPTVESGGTAIVTISSQEAVASGAIDISSNSGVTFSSVSGGTANGSKVAFASSTNVSGTIATYTFSVPSVETDTTYTVKFKSEDMADEEGNPVDSSDATATITVKGTGKANPGNTEEDPSTSDSNPKKEEGIPKEPEPKEEKGSDNNHLSSLTVSVGTLTPEFHRDNQDYTLEFPKDFDFKTLTSITVASTLEDETASKEGDGTYDVKEGENTISIRVTAEQGNYRTYVIKFTKAAEVKASDLKLSSLVINMKDTAGKMTAATLMPNFKPDVFEYSMKVSKDIESLSITPTTDLEDVEIKVDGGKNLIPGKNVVTITLTSKKDNKVISKYVINVEKEKEEAAATNSEEENKGGWSIKEWLLLIAGIAFVALIVVLVVLFIIMRRNKLEGEDEFNEDGEEDETKIEAEISEHIRNFDKPEVEEEINIDSAEEKEVEPKLDFVEEEKETEEPKQEIDFSKDPDELPVEEVKEEKVVEEKKELPLIETTLDDIRETERKLDEEDPRGRYRGKRFE